ncbi:MAG: hypothetical protein Q9182_006059 [Xanthomendoza sp. 2 TL-2023]
MSAGRQQARPKDTGTWGYGLYQSDVDLEMLDLVSIEAANMMSDPECLNSSLLPGYFTLRVPIDRAAAVRQLEAGVLHRLVRRFSQYKNHGAVVILGVVSMELGVKINPEDKLAMRMALMRWDIYEVKRDQIVRALEGYSNDGTEWRFDGKRIMEPARITDKAELPAQAVDKNVESQTPKIADEDAITPVNPAPGRNLPQSAINAKNNAQFTTLGLISNNKKSQFINNRARIQKPSNVNRVTFWFPASTSQPNHHKQAKEERMRKPGESRFTLPGKKSPKVPMQDMVGHFESLYRLPVPSSIPKEKTKGFTWKDYMGREHMQKI